MFACCFKRARDCCRPSGHPSVAHHGQPARSRNVLLELLFELFEPVVLVEPDGPIDLGDSFEFMVMLTWTYEFYVRFA